MAKELLEPFDLHGKLILADKGYDSDKFIKWVEERRGTVVIPSRVTAKKPREIDQLVYNERHLVENLFLKLKNNIGEMCRFYGVSRSGYYRYQNHKDIPAKDTSLAQMIAECHSLRGKIHGYRYIQRCYPRPF